MYKVYWIKSSKHIDVFSQGYVGITKNISSRIKAHRKNRKKTPLTDAIKSFGFDNLTVEVLHEVDTLSAALELEEKYRPSLKIGWNLQKGGEIGVESSWYTCPENKLRHSIATSNATKLGILAKDTKEARSKRAKEAWDRERPNRDGWSVGEKNGKAKLKESEVLKIKTELIPNGLSNRQISAQFGVRDYVIAFIRSGKTWKHV